MVGEARANKTPTSQPKPWALRAPPGGTPALAVGGVLCGQARIPTTSHRRTHQSKTGTTIVVVCGVVVVGGFRAR